MSPGVGEAENSISAGLVDAMKVLQLRGVTGAVTWTQAWHSSPVGRSGKLLLQVMSECNMRIY